MMRFTIECSSSYELITEMV